MESLENRAVFAADFDFALGIGSTGSDVADAVATDPAGNSYMAGYFNGTVDFDPAVARADNGDVRTAAGAGDIYVTKHAPDGTFLWVHSVPSVNTSSSGVIRAIATDAIGNVYIGGDFRGSIDFGTNILTSAGNKDALAAKLTSDGTVRNSLVHCWVG